MTLTQPEDSDNFDEKGNNSKLTQISYAENKEDLELGSLEGQLYAFLFETVG